MKRIKIGFTICLMLMLVAIFGGSVAKASNDLTVSSNKQLTSKFNNYDNVKIKSGATLSLAKRSGEPVGLEICKSLVVEKGGKLAGDGILIFHRGATFSGVTLYYIYDGEYRAIPKGMQLDVLGDRADDFKPEFYYDSSKGVYVLNSKLNGGNPFEVNLSEREICVAKNGKHQLSLAGVTEGVKWSTSDESIATVSKSGVVIGKGLGRAVITATYGDQECFCDVEVVNRGLSFKEMYLKKGTEFFLRLTGTDVKSVKSSNKKIATISKKLAVFGVEVGDCTITVKGKNGKKYKCKVHVEE